MPTIEEVVTSSWTPPNTVTGFSGTAVEPSSHVMLNWDTSALADADFVMYRIYRREPGGVWATLVDITNKTIATYNDKTAGQTTNYQYKITQYKAVVGDVPLESDSSDIVSIALTTDGWFIVNTGSLSFDAMELNVTSEEHSSVVQQEVFEPLAASRKRIVRGSVLGDEGSFTAIFDQADSKVARERLDQLKRTVGPHILKSPFGDVWFVSFDAPAFKYTTGGHLEITMGWVQVV